MTRRPWWAAPALALGLLTGCGDEDPVGLGRGLVPGGDVQTFEVVLDAARFLAGDTTLRGFSRALASPFLKVADAAEGGVTARALARFSSPPPALQVRVNDDSVAVDSMLRYVSGRLIVRVDTALSAGPGPVVLRLLRTQEEWHGPSAGWQLRVDTVGDQRAWSAPGGGAVAEVDSAVWTPGEDSVVIAVDSATIAAWSDTLDATRGGLLRAETAGADLSLTGVALRLDARPSVRPDTLIQVTVATQTSTFIYDPPPPDGPGLRVGGIPAWRSFLRLLPALDTVRVPCPDAAAGCTLPLGTTTVNFAGLVLTPVEAPEGFALERPVLLQAREALATSELPLGRTPLGPLAGARSVDPEEHEPGAPIEVPITDLVANLLAGDDDGVAESGSVVALVTFPETSAFGVVSFAPASAATPPRLRLVLTVGSDLEIR